MCYIGWRGYHGSFHFQIIIEKALKTPVGVFVRISLYCIKDKKFPELCTVSSFLLIKREFTVVSSSTHYEKILSYFTYSQYSLQLNSVPSDILFYQTRRWSYNGVMTCKINFKMPYGLKENEGIIIVKGVSLALEIMKEPVASSSY
ncbi:hypothetical protein EGR_09939 [Echinococcus granulosus]|uniref:Uncharacterized protein n=1 Tax=Echinococcus granulosus TaxID=6210 RepID=W6U2A7_ECHGR|nr:hypothetical protein EGR_09939 [Echinococcus granulosus]EUB55198.1 hypothetical protein EGR_09939 [Echinococcus granulosus]